MKDEQTKMSFGVIFATLLLMFFTLYFPQVYHYLFNEPFSTKESFLASRFAIWIILVIVLIYSLLIEKQTFLLWKEQKYKIGFSIVAVISVYFIAIFSAGIANAVVHFISPEKLSTKLLNVNNFFKNNYILLFFTCFTAGITEELLMRGYIQPRLAVITQKPWIAILLSSFIFGILHISYGTVSQVVGPFMIGLVFALFYQKYRSILILIIAHFLIDFISLNFMHFVNVEKFTSFISL